MRCPKCRLVVSDRRDICPECQFDLRPEKSRLGLAISDPSATYEKLVEKLKISLEKQKELDAKRPRPRQAPPGAKRKRKKGSSKRKQAKKPQLKFLVTFRTLTERFFLKRTRPEPVEAKPEASPQPEAKAAEVPAAAPLPVEAPKSGNIPPLPDAEESHDGALNFDSSEFDRLFDEEEMNKADGMPDLFAELTAALGTDISQTKGITESLRSVKFGEPTAALPAGAQSLATFLPPVLELSEDADSLEEQLDKLLSSDLSEFSAAQEIPITAASGNAGLEELGLEEPPVPFGFTLPPVLTMSVSQIQLAQAPVAPEVMEFNDDDRLLEEQLDEMIGDDLMEISAVRTNQPKSQALNAGSTSMQIADDLEISFEFDLEGFEGAEETEEPEPESAAADGIPEEDQAPEELIESLESALTSLETELEERSLTPESPESPESGEQLDEIEHSLEQELAHVGPAVASIPAGASIFARPVIPSVLQNDPSSLSKYLLDFLAGTFGCSVVELFENQPRPPGIETPIEDELLKSLTAELDSELSALTQEGCVIHGSEELEPISPRPVVTKAADVAPSPEPEYAGGWNAAEEDLLAELEREERILGISEIVTHGIDAPAQPEVSVSRVPESIPDSSEGWTAADEELLAALEGEESGQTMEIIEMVARVVEAPEAPDAPAELLSDDLVSGDLVSDDFISDGALAEELQDLFDAEEAQNELFVELEQAEPDQEDEVSTEIPETVSRVTFDPMPVSPAPVEAQTPAASDSWSTLEEELVAGMDDEDETFEVSEMVTHTVDEKTVVLFDTAIDALQDSRLDDAFEAKVMTSVNRGLENTKLEEVFEAFGEAALEDFENPGSRLPPGFVISEWTPPPFAPLWKRPCCFFLDAGLSLIVAAVYVWFGALSDAGRSLLIQNGLGGAIILLPVMMTFGLAALITQLAFAGLIWGRGQTVGQKLFGCRTYMLDDEQVSLPAALQRMSMGLTDACFGFPGSLLALSPQRRSVVDRVSGTCVCVPAAE